MNCVCGHSPWGHRGQTGVCCDGNLQFCTCTEYQPDTGGDGDTRYPGPDWKSDRYDGIYQRPGGYRLDESESA